MAGALLPAPGRAPDAARSAALLGSLFEEVLLVGEAAAPGVPGRPVPAAHGPRGALADLVGALEASGTESVLAVGSELPRPSPALLLALVAWPEADVVAPRPAAGPQPRCALYRREAVLPVARARLAAGARDLAELLGSVGTAYLEAADLAELDPEG